MADLTKTGISNFAPGSSYSYSWKVTFGVGTRYPSKDLRYDPQRAGVSSRAHTVYALHYHFVFITKYRKPVLSCDVGTAVRELIRDIVEARTSRFRRGTFGRAHPSAAERPALPRAEPGDAGDQGENVASSPPRSSKAAGGVLGPALVGACLPRVQERERHGQRDCAVYPAPACRAPGRRPVRVSEE